MVVVDMERARELARELVEVLEGEEPADPETIDGKGLKELRERAGLTLSEASNRACISRTYLWEMETDKVTSLEKNLQLITLYESIIAAKSRA